ncbi:DHA2 family efflux MFS transporter permease subunit [Chitinophaga barathri]|uniref:DHA2 family efflux MFS transporter permease subunit n=1 Tax=Chitinophaga barathri TaxID=1647451 RepID=A0A3N4MDV7_9BACT|nr:DHA2 family efflux MFS transporter permease subunit [Chitinophaga barathri]RPD41941.1 DHA2 family efflux MFS transporter permease subunit [Chitinophaga barathri]
MQQSKAGILITLMLGTLMASLDSSIVNISLPVMQEQFGVRMDEVQWVVTAYMIAFSVFMPLTNWLKNRIGFFNLYVISLSVFTFGSLLCSMSKSLEWLVVSRVIQAVGGGALQPTVLAMLTYIFPPEVRGKMLGWWGFGVVLGPALGPTLGGILTEHLGWPSIFYINVPIGAIAFSMSFYFLGFMRRQEKVRQKFDTPGFLLLTTFLISLQLGISRLEKDSITLYGIIIYFAVSLLALLFFILWERSRVDGIYDIRIFRNIKFVSALMVTAVRSAALFGGVFLLPFLLQRHMHFSEMNAGLLLLPGSVSLAILMPISGSWVDHHSPRGIVVIGLLLLALTMVLFGRVDVGTGVGMIILAMFIRGVGLGCLTTPITVATVNSVKPSLITQASSLNNLVLQVAGASGVALLSVVHQQTRNHYLRQHFTEAEAEHMGLQYGFTVSAVLLVCAIIPALFISSKKSAKVQAVTE